MKIKNWKKYQHYKDRNPPWIKLHRTLLDDRRFHALDPLASKVLVMCWLLAAEDESGEGGLPTPEDIAFRIRMDEDSVKAAILNLNHWIDGNASNTLADCNQVACLETETETEIKTETESYKAPDPNFQNLKYKPDEAAKLCELATTKYKNIQHSSQIMPSIHNLLAQLPFETIFKAIENESQTFDNATTSHQYRPNFQKHFQTAKMVQEMADRAPVAPVSLEKSVNERIGLPKKDKDYGPINQKL